MALAPVRITVRQRIVLLWGKARRLFLGLLCRRYVRESIARRTGECLRCGACCRLAYRCQFLRHTGDVTECRFHKQRPLNCRLFPIDERDLADRDIVAPHSRCGYGFNGKPDSTETAADERPHPGTREHRNEAPLTRQPVGVDARSS